MGHDIENIKLNYSVLEQSMVEVLALVGDLSDKWPPASRYSHNPVDVVSLDNFSTAMASIKLNISKVWESTLGGVMNIGRQEFDCFEDVATFWKNYLWNIFYQTMLDFNTWLWSVGGTWNDQYGFSWSISNPPSGFSIL